MVNVKLCDICIVKNNTVRQSTVRGSMRTGKTIHICEIHRKTFKSSSIEKISSVIQESTYKKMPELLAIPRTINT